MAIVRYLEGGLHYQLYLAETCCLNLRLFLKDKHRDKGSEIHLPVSGTEN